MTKLADFIIISKGPISKEFLNRNILTFGQAAFFVKQLPYGRNLYKNDWNCVFTDNCGTCSTKHVLLKRLADENNYLDLKLMVGLFEMNHLNTPEISGTLLKNNLAYIPEAHCYLRYESQILDLTRKNSDPSDFLDVLIEEIEIMPDQISDFKANYHKNYLGKWINNNHQIKLTLSEIWRIREQCIQDIENN